MQGAKNQCCLVRFDWTIWFWVSKNVPKIHLPSSLWLVKIPDECVQIIMVNFYATQPSKFGNA